MAFRKIKAVYPAETMTEGMGVTVHRTIGKKGLMNLDPFLLLDEFEINAGAGAGFPEHPHRGFETMTYMLSGSIRHTDTVGNSGIIKTGDAQWMTAGSGIIHSEMPVEENGIVHGLQLWVNLPSNDKMKPPQYRDASTDSIPLLRQDGYSVRVIAGEFAGIQGPINDVTINPLYLDVIHGGHTTINIPINPEHTVFLYIIDGNLTIDEQVITKRNLIILDGGEYIHIEAGAKSRFILVAGRMIDEPVARYGPFVMNTRAEIMTAIDNFNNGRFPGQSKS